jgi:hypothetical protein
MPPITKAVSGASRQLLLLGAQPQFKDGVAVLLKDGVFGLADETGAVIAKNFNQISGFWRFGPTAAQTDDGFGFIYKTAEDHGPFPFQQCPLR